MSELSVGTGQSDIENSFKSGQETASEAFRQHGGTPEVLIILGSPRFDHKNF